MTSGAMNSGDRPGDRSEARPDRSLDSTGTPSVSLCYAQQPIKLKLKLGLSGNPG